MGSCGPPVTSSRLPATSVIYADVGNSDDAYYYLRLKIPVRTWSASTRDAAACIFHLSVQMLLPRVAVQQSSTQTRV